MSQHSGFTPLSTADRKKQLIAEGQMYRFGIAEAREEIAASLQMDTLARKALHGVASGAAAMLASKVGKGGVSALLPLAVSGIGSLVKRFKSGSASASESDSSSSRLPVRKLLLAGAIGLVGAVVARRKLKQRDEEESR